MAKRRNAVTLGALLRSWRLEAGVSQAEAAALVGTTQSTWCRWERDESVPDAGDLNRIVEQANGALSAEALVGAARPIRAAG